MPSKIPVVSGKVLIKFLTGMGYRVARQKGSHVRLEKDTPAGKHKLTVPQHDPVAKGTLNDIMSRVAMWNQVPKESLFKELR